MKKTATNSALTRRSFLGRVAAGTAAVSTANGLGAADPKANPYEYKVDHLFKTDPKWLRYDLETRMACPRKDARRVALGPEDALYLAAGKFVTIFQADGSKRGELELPEAVRALAVDKDGTVYVAVKDHVEVFSAQGQRKAVWPSPAAKTWFTGLAVGENDLFAGDAGNRVVLRFDKTGKLQGRIGEKNPARNIPGIVTPSPFLDVEIGKDGLLWVTNPGQLRVEAYNFAGDLELFWGKPTMGVEGFGGCCNPINLAQLPDGRWITCEKGIPRVKIYTAQGVFEGVVCGAESFPESLRTGAGLAKGDGSQAGVDAAVDSRGRVYVLDQVAGELRIMKPKAKS